MSDPTPFQKGDLIECVNPIAELVEGQEYTVKWCWHDYLGLNAEFIARTANTATEGTHG